MCAAERKAWCQRPLTSFFWSDRQKQLFLSAAGSLTGGASSCESSRQLEEKLKKSGPWLKLFPVWVQRHQRLWSSSSVNLNFTTRELNRNPTSSALSDQRWRNSSRWRERQRYRETGYLKGAAGLWWCVHMHSDFFGSLLVKLLFHLILVQRGQSPPLCDFSFGLQSSSSACHHVKRCLKTSLHGHRMSPGERNLREPGFLLIRCFTQ